MERNVDSAPVRAARGIGGGFVRSTAFEVLSRAGFVARGLIYGIIGLFAFGVAVSDTGKLTVSRARSGRWRPSRSVSSCCCFLRSASAATRSGALSARRSVTARRTRTTRFERLGGLGSGLVYGGLCIASIKLLTAVGGRSRRRSPTKRLRASSTGRGPLARRARGGRDARGGRVPVRQGVRRTFLEELKTGEMSAGLETWVTWIGTIGHVARAVVSGWSDGFCSRRPTSSRRGGGRSGWRLDESAQGRVRPVAPGLRGRGPDRLRRVLDQRGPLPQDLRTRGQHGRGRTPGDVMPAAARSGDGNEPPPLVCVHGLSGSSRWWTDAAALIDGSGPVVLLDVPRFLKPSEVTTWLAGRIEELGATVDLAGHSLGALASVRVAALRPSLSGGSCSSRRRGRPAALPAGVRVAARADDARCAAVVSRAPDLRRSPGWSAEPRSWWLACGTCRRHGRAGCGHRSDASRLGRTRRCCPRRGGIDLARTVARCAADRHPGRGSRPDGRVTRGACRCDRVIPRGTIRRGAPPPADVRSGRRVRPSLPARTSRAARAMHLGSQPSVQIASRSPRTTRTGRRIPAMWSPGRSSSAACRRGEPSRAHSRVVGEQDAPQRRRLAQRGREPSGQHEPTMIGSADPPSDRRG